MGAVVIFYTSGVELRSEVVEFCALLSVARGPSLDLQLNSSLWMPFGSWPSLRGR